MVKIEAKAVVIFEKGKLPEVLKEHTFTVDTDAIGEYQVVGESRGSPVNVSDLAQTGHAYKSQPTWTTELGGGRLAVLGNEGAFEIIAVGKGVTDFEVGDIVIPNRPSFGTWRSHIVETCEPGKHLPLRCVSSHKNPGLTAEQASTIRVNPLTAYDLINDYIKDWDPNGNDWIIQSGGNSQVGKYLVQFAKLRNIKTISIIRHGKPDHDEIVKELKDLGATHVITDVEAASDKFKNEIVPSWVGSGAIRLATDCVGGDTFRTLSEYLTGDYMMDPRRPYLVTYGFVGSFDVNISGIDILSKGIIIAPYWLTSKTRLKREEAIHTLEEVSRLIIEGKIKHVPFVTHKYDAKVGWLNTYLMAIRDISKGKQVVTYK